MVLSAVPPAWPKMNWSGWWDSFCNASSTAQNLQNTGYPGCHNCHRYHRALPCVALGCFGPCCLTLHQGSSTIERL